MSLADICNSKETDMKVLIYGAGVIGTVYGWQLSKAGHDVTLLVRKGKKAVFQDGICIRCIDQRVKGAAEPVETCFHAAVVEELSPENDYDWIMVAVKSNQLDEVLSVLAENSGSAHILFFQNNWWGDQKIKAHLQPEQYLFGFSRLFGGWENGNTIECILFNAPGMGTMLGEKDGRITPRLQQMAELLKSANLSPEISLDILGWLQFHYVEYLGATGAILKAGMTQAFVKDRELVRKAILATREGLAICRARGADMKAAPSNLKFFNLPLFCWYHSLNTNIVCPISRNFLKRTFPRASKSLLHSIGMWPVKGTAWASKCRSWQGLSHTFKRTTCPNEFRDWEKIHAQAQDLYPMLGST
jgi:ketopantoate reductase